MEVKPEFIDLVRATPTEPRSGEGDMAVLQDGRLFFAYTSFRQAADNAVADIVARTSADGGHTWTAPSVLISHNEAEENVMSVSLLRTATGRLLLFYLRKDSLTQCRAWVRESADETRSWSDAVCCTPAARYHVIVNNCALQLGDGRLVLPYEVCDAVWVKQERITAATAISDDDGRSWRHSNEVYTPKRGAMEARVIERLDGSLWMLMRTDQGTLWESSSADRGLSWTPPRSSGLESPQAPFVLTRIPATGDLLLIRNPVADLAQGSHQGHRTPLEASISQDDGRTWSRRRLIEGDTARTYCYVSTTFSGDTVVLSYYVGRPEMPLECLRVARVPLAWFYA